MPHFFHSGRTRALAVCEEPPAKAIPAHASLAALRSSQRSCATVFQADTRHACGRISGWLAQTTLRSGQRCASDLGAHEQVVIVLMLLAGTASQNASVVQTVINTATDRNQVLAFNLASEALNNSYFLSRLVGSSLPSFLNPFAD